MREIYVTLLLLNNTQKTESADEKRAAKNQAVTINFRTWNSWEKIPQS